MELFGDQPSRARDPNPSMLRPAVTDTAKIATAIESEINISGGGSDGQ